MNNPDWGHPLQTPEGNIIRVPAFAFPRLRWLGMLVNGQAILSPRIYEFIDPQYDTLTDGLRHLLGRDLSGPEWLVCRCMKCLEREALTDNTAAPGRAHSQLAADLAISQMRIDMRHHVPVAETRRPRRR